MAEKVIAPMFEDSRNINVGKARVIWAESIGTLVAGWVLLGGRRTQDFAAAHEYASRLNWLIEKLSH